MDTISHRNGKRRQSVEYFDMPTAALLGRFTARLVDREASHNGGRTDRAIEAVARKVSSCVGTIKNLLRCKNGVARVKSVCFDLGQRIVALAIADIENERKKLEHERTCLLALGASPDPTALAEVEAGFEIVDRALARMRGRP